MRSRSSFDLIGGWLRRPVGVLCVAMGLLVAGTWAVLKVPLEGADPFFEYAVQLATQNKDSYDG